MTRPARHRILERRKRDVEANTALVVRAILNAARKRGIDVGVSADGADLILSAPLRVPRETCLWFEHWIDQFKDELIGVIQAENADKQNAEVM